MLKKKCILFLGLVVFAGSACVTPTHASSAQDIILTRIQTGGEAGATDELIVLYNSSAQVIDITNWYLKNKSGVIARFSDDDETTKLAYVVQPNEYVTVASTTYVESHSFSSDFYTLTYKATNQSSGSIVASSDTVQLINDDNEVVNSYTWSDGKTSPSTWARLLLFSLPDIYTVTGASSDWRREANSNPPVAVVAIETPVANDDTTIDENEGDNNNDDNNGSTNTNTGTEAGTGADTDTSTNNSNTTTSEGQHNQPYITELLANPSGSDAGNEFIELYNPSDKEVSLVGFSLQVGTTKVKTYSLDDVTIPALGYVALYNTGARNFTLSNTAGKVQLLYNNNPVGDAIEYENAKDDMSWSLIDGEWVYSEIVTPAQPNQATPLEAEDDDTAAAASTQKPCAANQYRNPATGRCKLIATASASTSTPCKTGYERNPETNRCRKIAVATTPTPCKEGYERNAETNRCRKIKAMTTADYAVAGVQTTADNNVKWYYWLGIVGVVVAVLAYGIWEWREELRAVLRKIVNKTRTIFMG